MKTKDAGLRIRIDRELREAFVAACRENDMPAAQVLREFMRLYVNAKSEQGDAADAPALPKHATKGQRNG